MTARSLFGEPSLALESSNIKLSRTPVFAHTLIDQRSSPSCDRFTFTELISFPNFVVLNHGDTWNGMGYTVWINFIILAPVVIFVVRTLLDQLDVPVLSLDLKWGVKKGRVTISGDFTLREVFYEIAILSFVGTMLEEFWHLMYAQFQPGVPVGPMLFVGLFGVIIIPNGWGITQTVLAWASMKNSKDPLCGAGCMRCSKYTWWAPIEILSGFSMLFLFGAGFYLGPAAVMAAGFVRLLELQHGLMKGDAVVADKDVSIERAGLFSGSAPALMLRK